MITRFWRCLSAVLILMLAPVAAAEDIDLFVQDPEDQGLPNILIVLDNSANWSRSADGGRGAPIFDSEMLALQEVFANLPVGPEGQALFRVGLMLYTETGSKNPKPDGGYVRAAIRDMDSSNRTMYAELVQSFDQERDKGSNSSTGLIFAEAYRYFDGVAPHAGNNKEKTDYLGHPGWTQPGHVGSGASEAIYGLPGNALDSRNGSPYLSPLDPFNCGGNYVIYISNGRAQDSSANSDPAKEALKLLDDSATAAGLSGALAPIRLGDSGSEGNWMDEWARFMYLSPRQIVSYTVDVDPETSGQGPGWTALLKSAASVGNGKYFVTTAQGGGSSIIDALNQIFAEIRSINTVFASVSLPVSVNTQGTYLNQVYIGMFRPDRGMLPRWPGNLKQYKLGIVEGELRTVDADGLRATNVRTGFVDFCARSYWTPTSVVESYWGFRPSGLCQSKAGYNAVELASSDFPDGEVVDKGGQAFVLRAANLRPRNPGERNMRVGSSGTWGSIDAVPAAFGTASVTPTMLGLGSTDTAGRDRLVTWMRGADNGDGPNGASGPERPGGSATTFRPSVHGDVVHSRPVAINYATGSLADSDPKVIVFYGGNDGLLRAVNGNREDDSSIGLVPPGGELWSFFAPEFLPQVRRLRDNAPLVNFDEPLAVPRTKPYGFDGPVAGYSRGGNHWIFGGLRRGGRALYSFDVSGLAEEPLVQPILKWRIGCDASGCLADYAAMGQTWSTPQVLETNGFTSPIGARRPMLMVGGGYDQCEDFNPHLCSGDTFKGNRVFVIDADNGQRLASLATDRPVAADVFVVADKVSGVARYAYAVDTGGNVYRIAGPQPPTDPEMAVPFGTSNPSNWTIRKIASLGCDGAGDVSGSADCLMNRKFLNGVDVVEESGTFYLLVGSGDREKPLRLFFRQESLEVRVQNYFFMIKDRPADPEWLMGEDVDCGSAIICLDSLLEIDVEGSDPTLAEVAEVKGWRLPLRSGEQSVTSAITVFGTTTFSTHEPTTPQSGVCTPNLGTARVYNVSFRNAAAVRRDALGRTQRDAQVAGGGLPPSPVAGRVRLDDGRVVPFIIGANPESSIDAALPTPPIEIRQPRGVTYWFIEK